ncbi:MAG: flavin-nucleotide-binding protein [Acidimicrobiaceae bacterium]|jgi:nitroimidazol reductase NimA-like FMN-containing flavoprotein (pyridoxamine 5'-phosphate oxidase superfamily)|nr:flavin-nucleotide-binding protein [Acidimicrobiaceae bacterium]
MRSETRLETLTRDECLAVLTCHAVGRLAVVVDGQPDIFPVNYTLDGERVIFRSGPGTKLDHASLARVAFEVDDLERELPCSVVMKGTAREFTEAIDIASERERTLAFASMVPSSDMHWVRIIPRTITGRRFVWS